MNKDEVLALWRLHPPPRTTEAQMRKRAQIMADRHNEAAYVYLRGECITQGPDTDHPRAVADFTVEPKNLKGKHHVLTVGSNS